MSATNDSLTPRERIAALERELAELRASMPAHSTPPSLLMRIEELEDELQEAQKAVQESPQRDGESEGTP